MAKPKELHFFDYNYDKGVDWYVKKFDRVRNENAVGEATPNYISDENAMPRIAELLPSVRLIVLLRNPVDRAYSHYWHNRARSQEDLDFASALEEEAERLRRSSVHGARFAYQTRSRYLVQLERMLSYFPMGSIFVGFCEELKDAPRSTYRHVCRFLGVDETFVPEELGRDFNKYVAFRSVAARRLTRRLRAARGQPLRFGGKLLGRLNSYREASYPPMDEKIRAHLANEFRDDCRGLSQLLGRELPFEL